MAVRRTKQRTADRHTGRSSDTATDNSAAPEPDEVNAHTSSMDRDALYAYHLERVTKKFKTMISADNVELLARLLGGDDGG
jgi:hypothetical protein